IILNKCHIIIKHIKKLQRIGLRVIHKVYPGNMESKSLKPGFHANGNTGVETFYSAGNEKRDSAATVSKNAFNNINKKIAVAMSGGIDSSMAAKILKDRGLDILGITIKFLPQSIDINGSGKETQSVLENIIAARTVCRELSIPHMVIDMSQSFEKYIIKPFCSEYLKGLTPNPCVECNRVIKFGLLLNKIKALGVGRIATGHYCRISPSKGTGLYTIKKGVDKKKDQSYFFWKLDQKQLSRIETPLGNYFKKDVREKADRFFPFLKKRRESQDICFIASKSYHSFLKKRASGIKEGDILDTEGRVIGRHKGYAFYTVGQRKGIGISHSSPLYVIKIIPESNQVFVGERHELDRAYFNAGDVNFISGTSPGYEFRAEVKVRYNSAGTPALIRMIDSSNVRVEFETPQNAVAPGQSAVFFNGDTLIGGGIISRNGL
ncbi:MAG: tRNA 2-thiouridine(34) synthase MnmA, partial [Actinobacteria bacterium]|nr:tRNA 2-thiouridine(34) synthase MnmA [Actinomycetota bacterium]